MAKVELSGNDIRLILEKDPELFLEVKGKILRSALKNACYIQLSEEVKRYLSNEAASALKEAGIEYQRKGYQDSYTIFSKGLKALAGGFEEYANRTITAAIAAAETRLEKNIQNAVDGRLSDARTELKLNNYIRSVVEDIVKKKVGDLLKSSTGD